MKGVQERRLLKKTQLKNGFTLIEVIISLALLGILSIAVGTFGMNSSKLHLSSKSMDQSYAIARSLCERYLAENTQMSHRTVVVRFNRMEDLPASISDLLDYGEETTETNGEALARAKDQYHAYIAILSCKEKEYLETLNVMVYSTAMVGQRCLSLRCARGLYET